MIIYVNKYFYKIIKKVLAVYSNSVLYTRNAEAKAPEEAAEIVRDSKVKAQKVAAAPTRTPLLHHRRCARSLTPATLIITE